MDESCAQCGAALPPNAAYCGSCGEPVNRRDRIELGDERAHVAPMGKRVLAFGLDLAIVWGVQTALNVLGLLFGIGLRPDRSRIDEYRECVRQAATPDARADCLSELVPYLPLMLLVSFLIPLAIAMTYWAVCNIRGTSIGKYAAGIRIVNARGERPGVARGLGRTLSALFLSTPLLWLGYWWAFWQPRHRTWHDMVAGTYVIRVSPADRERVLHSDTAEAPQPPGP